MATGKPVVASNIAGYASVLTSGSEGILVPPKQEVPLAQAITSLIKHEALRRRMGAAGQQTASGYGWSRFPADYELLSELLMTKTPPA